MPLLESLQLLSMGGVFLGIMLNLIVIIMIVVSILLIDTLIMVSIENKSFDMGILRLVGIPKNHLFLLILIESIMFVIPAFVCSYICIFPLLTLLSRSIKNILGVGFPVIPNGVAILKSILIGVIVPVLSMIYPLYTIHNKRLSETLDTTHSKIIGVRVTIDYTLKKINWPLLIMGLVSVIFGIAVYYFLPLGFIT